MFWRKKKSEKNLIKKKKPDLLGGSPVFWYLEKEHGLDGDTIFNLRMVELENKAGENPVTKVRVYDPKTVAQRGIVVEDYETFDSHLELILYEGYYCKGKDKETEIHIEKK